MTSKVYDPFLRVLVKRPGLPLPPLPWEQR